MKPIPARLAPPPPRPERRVSHVHICANAVENGTARRQNKIRNQYKDQIQPINQEGGNQLQIDYFPNTKLKKLDRMESNQKVKEGNGSETIRIVLVGKSRQAKKNKIKVNNNSTRKPSVLREESCCFLGLTEETTTR